MGLFSGHNPPQLPIKEQAGAATGKPTTQERVSSVFTPHVQRLVTQKTTHCCFPVYCAHNNHGWSLLCDFIVPFPWKNVPEEIRPSYRKPSEHRTTGSL